MQKKELLKFKNDNNIITKVIVLGITILLTINVGSAIGIFIPTTTTPASTPNRNIQWDVTMNFTEPSGKFAYVIFGEATDANDGPPADIYDIGLPPPPPEPYIRSWFDDDLPFPYNTLWHDYRHYNTTNVHKQWNMTAKWANSTGGGTNMTMTWNTTEFTGCEYNSVILMRKGQLNATWYIAADMLTENNFSWSHEYYYLDPPGIYMWFLTDEFKINATYVNVPPVAFDDFYDTDEDITLNVATGVDVLQNDTDDDGPDPLTAIKESDPSHGILTAFNANGTFVYDPDPDFNGADSFTYKAYDGENYSNIATVTITVNPVNDDPSAINDTAITPEDTAVTIDVLENDHDIDGDTLYLESFDSTSAEGGTITRDDNATPGDTSDDKLVFTPFLDFFSPPDDTFEYNLSDGNGATDNATVTITITGENDPPTSADNTVSTLEDIAYTFVVGDFPFTDVDGDSLSHVKVTVLESVGDLTWDGAHVAVDDEIPVADIAAGKLVFTPVLNGNGMGYDSFDFMVKDDTVYSASSYTMTIDVTPQNDDPTAINDTAVTSKNTAVTIDVLENDHDIDGDTLYLESSDATSAEGGTITRDDNATPGDTSDDKLVYTPPLDFISPPDDTFEYNLSDGNGATDTGTVTINVTEENNPPTSADNTVSTLEDTTYTFLLTDFAFSDPDAGDQLEYVKITQLESDGSLKLDGIDVTLNQEISRDDIIANKLTFVPDPDENGVDYADFKFKVSDGIIYSLSDYTISVDVTAVNDPPTSADNTVSTLEDIAYTFVVGDFPFTDVDGDSLSHVKVTVLESVGDLTWDGAHVAVDDEIPVADIAAGKLVFTPVLNGNGMGYDNFDFMVKDDTVYSASSYTMTIDVTPQNDDPVAIDDTASVEEHSSNNQIDVLANDYDIEGDTLEVINVTTPTHGTATYDEDYVHYTPEDDYSGSDSFSYTITDNNGSTGVIATVYVTVIENEPPEKPDRPSGETRGKVGVEYSYTTSTTDSNDDQIYYYFSWGDDSTSGWIGPFESGEAVEANHTWEKRGNYEIKVKTKDEHGLESEWSDSLPIKMPLLQYDVTSDKNIFNFHFFENFRDLINRLLDILAENIDGSFFNTLIGRFTK